MSLKKLHKNYIKKKYKAQSLINQILKNRIEIEKKKD
jgi:hypothetical protein